MEKQNITGMPEGIKIVIGTWLAGSELQHLKALQPADITDNKDAIKIIGKIKSYYSAGISKGVKVGKDIRLKLFTELQRIGYDEVELCGLIDKAKDASTAYTQQIVKMYDKKSATLLKEIDYDKPGAQQQAKQVMEKYTLEGVEAIKEPMYDLAKILRERRENQGDEANMVFGRTSLLKKIGGIAPGQLISVTAPPATGKSALVGQMALRAAQAGLKVLFDTLEMSLYRQCEIGDRWLANLSYGTLTLDQIAGFDEMKTIDDHKNYNDAVMALDELVSSGKLIPMEFEKELARIEEQVELHQPDILIIDQLTQLKDSRNPITDQRLRYCHLTSSLKALAQATGTAIIMVCQANRQATLSSGKPNITWHKESASIEEDSDKCLALQVPEDGEEDEEEDERSYDIDIWVTKNRSGKRDFFVRCRFNPDKQLFTETIDDEEIPF